MLDAAIGIEVFHSLALLNQQIAVCSSDRSRKTVLGSIDILMRVAKRVYRTNSPLRYSALFAVIGQLVLRFKVHDTSRRKQLTPPTPPSVEK